DTIARRFLYELADEARLASVGSGYAPLANLVEKLRREERYHRMHATVWIDRLARAGGEARARLEAALAELGPDAATVFTPLAGEEELLRAGILTRPLRAAEAAWRADVTSVFVPLGLHVPLAGDPPIDGRSRHSDAFRWLWTEFTSVRRLAPEAVW
ncbi:MAG TPA: Phenylacetic acid catabolic protein, partial [Candidatus Limnocylindrales bacterium]